MKFITKNNYKSHEGQTFSPFRDEYQYSEATGKPEKVGTIDCQELIQSYEDVALSRVFDKFLPEDFDEFRAAIGKPIEVDESAPIVDAPTAQSDIDFIQEVASQADELREAYGLPEEMPRAMVLETVAKIAKGVLNSGKNIRIDNGSVGDVSAGDGDNKRASAASNVDTDVDKDA